MKFEIGDWLIHLPTGAFFEVEGVNCDFVVMVDCAGESHTVMPEDYNQYEVDE